MLHVLNAADAWLTHEAVGRRAHMTSTDDDNPFPDRAAVLVRYPRSKAGEQGDRSAWPWLAGEIVSRCAEDEWQVCVEDRTVAELEDGTTSPEGTPAEDFYWPCCYRDANEIRLRPAMLAED
jgi:hypothetical protein